MTGAGSHTSAARHPVMRWVDRHKYALAALYVPVFLIWFMALEARPPGGEWVAYNPLDDLIPFREEFILAYAAWFPYLLGFVWWILARPKGRTEFPRAATLLITGMTVCMVIYTFWPNTQLLRPNPYPRDNVFTDIVKALQGFDTPTNVCPSLHVYTSLVVNHCIQRSPQLRGRTWLRAGSWVLLVLIASSTVFLKQHSVVDVFWAVVLFVALVWASRLVYRSVEKHRSRTP
ncbi:phosphatase PAP2 family protein [Nigerium massiliense]|uniref:phosphatase PAP2 family protein n=1 Tax=Nigerium massiliense TaxID=1522317 RepID=UPI0012FD5B90|nr:phosphatase PAP2 family protein [Nigerium massiliense]